MRNISIYRYPREIQIRRDDKIRVYFGHTRAARLDALLTAYVVQDRAKILSQSLYHTTYTVLD